MGRCEIMWASLSTIAVNGSDNTQIEKEKIKQSRNDEEQSVDENPKRKKKENNNSNKTKKMTIHRDAVSAMERVCIGALSGGMAGGFTNVVLHPIDTIKTKLQTRGASSLYSGPFDVISKVLASQGICGLYSGVQAALVGSIMSSSVYFATYELAKCTFSQVFTFPQTITPPMAAALGNIVSSAILVPKEVVKQRMQAGAIGSARQVFLQTIKNDGFRGLYSGYSAALLRNIPTNMISFSTFEYLKMGWLRLNKESVLEPWQSVISGALAGAISAAATTPLDVVKTRLMTQARAMVTSSLTSSDVSGIQVEAAARAHAIANYTYKGVRSTMQQICKEEGLSALMTGMGPRIFYSALFSALGFCVFETTRTFFLVRYVQEKEKSKNKNNNLTAVSVPISTDD